MNGALLTSKTGLQAQDLQLQYISNNIANASSNTYKASRPEFAPLMSIQVRDTSATDGGASGGLSVGTGVQAIGKVVDFSQGQPVATERETDIMIQGNGFFKVTNEDGDEFYTRNGAFIVNEDGQISTIDNYVLDPAIDIPDDAETITFNRDGTVVVKSTANPEGEEVGQIELYKFMNNNGLRQLDSGLYQAADTSGDEIAGLPDEDSFGYILQGYVEGSNVDTVVEMVNMIDAQRNYEMASKCLEAANSLMQTLNNVV